MKTKTLFAVFSAAGVCMLALGAIAARPLFNLGAGASADSHSLTLNSTNGKFTKGMAKNETFTANTKEGSEIQLKIEESFSTGKTDIGKASTNGFGQCAIYSQIVNVTPINGIKKVTVVARYDVFDSLSVISEYTQETSGSWDFLPSAAGYSGGTVTFTLDYEAEDQYHLPTYVSLKFIEGAEEPPTGYIDIVSITYDFTCVEPN